MAKRMLVDATHPEETRVVVVNGTRLEEFDFETSTKKQLKGNIYLAKVVRIEPSLQAAFVEYGGNRHGFLAFSEIHPDYYQIPVADRERLLAEQHREPLVPGEMDDEAHDAGTVDKSDIVEAREEREALVAGWVSSAPEPADEPAPAEPFSGNAAVLESTPLYGAATDAQAEGDVPAPIAAAAIVSEAAPTESVPEPVPLPERAGGDAAVELTQAQPLDRADTIDVMEHPAPGTPAEPDGSLETPASPPPIAESRPSEVLRGPLVDAEAVNGAEAADIESPHGEPAIAPVVELHGNTQVEVALDPAEAPQPAVTVETVGGEDLVEVRRPRRQPPSRQYKIQEVIKRRQIMLVQVVKEERGNKGAALTTFLSLAGRYCVLMPNAGRGGGISRKITSAADRKRMKEMLSELEVPGGMGVILRTAGLERSKPEIRRDYEYLMRLWDGIREFTMRSTAPALIYEESDLIKRSIRDLYNSEIDEVMVEGEAGFQRARDFMRQLVPQHARKVQSYNERIPLFHRYQIESQLDAMHSPIVQLRTGAYIVLNPTEALVAIDVNSGRATKERNIEETALRTNLEAADEIARQVRLRDLSGLIVIDFIDMEDNRHQQQVERRLKEAMRSDRARIQIGRISPFGLLELSRQRLRPSLLENFTELCPHCEGTGRVRSVESTALHVLRGIEEEGIRQRAGEIMVSVPVPVALYILNHKRRALAEIEGRYGFMVMVAGTDKLIPPQFQIERTRARIAPVATAEGGPQTPLTASAIYEEFDEEYDEDADAAPAEAGEDGGEGTAGDEAGDDGGRRRKRRRRRRRRDGEDMRTAEGAPAEIVNGEAPEDDAEAPGEAEGESANDDERDAEREGDRDGGRRRRRGRRGGRNRRRGDEGGVPYANDDNGPSGLEPPPVETEELEPVDMHAGETEADDSLAPAPAEPVTAEAIAEAARVLEPAAAAPTAVDTIVPARANDDLPPAPAPSAGTDVPTVVERPAAPATAMPEVSTAAEALSAPEAMAEPAAEKPAPAVPVTHADSPPEQPRRGWWSRR